MSNRTLLRGLRAASKDGEMFGLHIPGGWLSV